jgi:hypothetical protein
MDMAFSFGCNIGIKEIAFFEMLEGREERAKSGKT